MSDAYGPRALLRWPADCGPSSPPTCASVVPLAKTKTRASLFGPRARGRASIGYTAAVVMAAVFVWGLAQRAPATGPAVSTVTVRQTLASLPAAVSVSRAAPPPQTLEGIRSLLSDRDFVRMAAEQTELNGIGVGDWGQAPTTPWAESVRDIRVEEAPPVEGELRYFVQVEATNGVMAQAAAESLVAAYAAKAFQSPLAEAHRQFDLRQQVADDASAAVTESKQALANFERDHAAELAPPPEPAPVAAAPPAEPPAGPSLDNKLNPTEAESAAETELVDEAAQLRAELAAMIQRRETLMESFTKAHPKVRDVDHQIADLEQAVAELPEVDEAPARVGVDPTFESLPDDPQVSVASSPASSGPLSPGAPLAPDPVNRMALLVRCDQLRTDLEVAIVQAEQAALAARLAAERVTQFKRCTVEIVDRSTSESGPQADSFAHACRPASLWAALAGLAAGFGVRHRVNYFRTPADLATALGVPLLGAVKPRGIRFGVIIGQALGSMSGLARAGAEFCLAIVLGWVVYLAVQDAGFLTTWRKDPWDAFAWAVGQLRQIGR